MTVEMVLNELSLQPAPSIIEARTRMRDFVETLRQATKRRVAKVVRTDELLLDLDLAAMYPIRKWLNDQDVSIDREVKRFFLAVTSKAPLLTDAPLEEARAMGMDCFYYDQRAKGLLVAYLLNGLAVSIGSSAPWDKAFVTIAIEELLDADIQTLEESIRHASTGSHVTDDHNEWITESMRLPALRSGAELWSKRAEYYPSLLFCAAVERHLSRYLTGAEEVTQISRRLTELNKYASAWNASGFDPNQVGSRVTPESPETLRQFASERTFNCPDGIKRVFSWHSRFTPGAGRLYFHPDIETQTITIGYIGPHLETILFG